MRDLLVAEGEIDNSRVYVWRNRLVGLNAVDPRNRKCSRGVMKRRRRVGIVYKSLPQWRRRFFELLRDRLTQEAIDLQVIYGQPGAKDAAKKDTVDLEWAQRIENRIVRFCGRELYWQPCLHFLRGADLVIVEQASKLLVNYVLQARYLLGGTR